MHCSQCGAEVAPSSRFCSNCGANVAQQINEKKCTACGAALKPGAKFCQSCGQPASQTAPVATPVQTALVFFLLEPFSTPRSPWVTLSLFLSIPIVVGIMFLLFYPRSNPQPVMPQQTPGAMPQATQQNGQDPFDMESMMPVFHQIDSLKNAVKENPQDTNALLHLAALFDMAGKYDQAAEYYRNLLAVTPENVEARMNLAGNYFNLKQNEAAIAELETALKHRPNYDYAMFNLGVIYASIHEHEKAAEWWNKVIALDASSELATRARESMKTLEH